MEEIDTRRILCCCGDFSDGMGAMVIVLGVQFIYTVVVWATMLASHPLSSLLHFFLFWFEVAAGVIIAVYLCQEDGSRVAKKCLPLAAFFMVVGSSLPLFAGILVLIANGLTHGGALFVIICSAVFTAIWANVYYASLYEVRGEAALDRVEPSEIDSARQQRERDRQRESELVARQSLPPAQTQFRAESTLPPIH